MHAWNDIDRKVVVKMTRLSAVSLILCVMAASILSAQAATTRMPYGSYLTRGVTDAHDFARLLRQDPVVAQRFANHYGMNNDAIADYVEKHGHVVTVTRSRSYTEYFIDKNGSMRKHHKLLRPGNKVLAVDGTPILDMKCGNPMNKSLPHIVAKAIPERQVLPPPKVAVKPPEAVPPPQVQITEKPAVPVLPTPPLAETPVQQPPVEATAPSSTELGWLLPSLVGIGLINKHPSGPPPPEHPKVPESSALVLGIVGTGFIITCYRRFRSR